MRGERPVIRKGHLLIIRQVEESHVIMDIGSTLYRARYLPALESPPRCRLRPEDCMIVVNVNSQALDALIITERLDRRAGTGDGCQYSFYDYQVISQREL
jgi:hypothetical protein